MPLRGSALFVFRYTEEQGRYRVVAPVPVAMYSRSCDRCTPPTASFPRR
jgi:hypothetical protein